MLLVAVTGEGACNERLLGHMRPAGRLSPLPPVATCLPCFHNCTFGSTNSGNLLTPKVLFFTPWKSLRCLVYTDFWKKKNPCSLPTDSTHNYVSFLAQGTSHYQMGRHSLAAARREAEGNFAFAKPQMSRVSAALHLQSILQNSSDFY